MTDLNEQKQSLFVCVPDEVCSDNQIALGQRVPGQADSGAVGFNRLKKQTAGLQLCISASPPVLS